MQRLDIERFSQFILASVCMGFGVAHVVQSFILLIESQHCFYNPNFMIFFKHKITYQICPFINHYYSEPAKFINVYCQELYRMEQMNKDVDNFKDEQQQSSFAESNVRSVVSLKSFQIIYKQFKEYKPRSALLDIQKLRASQNLKLKKFKQSVYFGEIVNSKRHGKGIMLHVNERLYQGNWQNDLKQGSGYEILANGAIYLGIYVNGRPEGVGKYIWPNGQFYEGEWLNGLRHGSGMWQGCKGDSYIGEWRKGKAQGYGVHVWVNGDRYQGQFKQCLKHGQGIEKFANGDLYKGEYSRGKPNGYGEYYWRNSSYFKGTFKDGLRQGHGLWKKGPEASDKYQGEYKDDKKNGFGIFSWATGNIYKGNYSQDLRHGYGQMYWNDGSYFKGLWQKGVQNGMGLIYEPKQGIKKGKFKDNVLIQIESQEPSINNRFTINNISKAGSIHKNTGLFLPKNPKISSRSMDAKKRLISMQQNLNIAQPIKSNRESNPLLRKGDKKVEQKTHTADVKNIVSNGPYYRLKERIPHSAFQMHKLHKRVITANNEQEIDFRINNQASDDIRKFARKLTGRKMN